VKLLALSATVFDTVNIEDTTPPSAPNWLMLIILTISGVSGTPVDTIPIFSAFTDITNHKRFVIFFSWQRLTSFILVRLMQRDTFKVTIMELGELHTLNIP